MACPPPASGAATPSPTSPWWGALARSTWPRPRPSRSTRSAARNGPPVDRSGSVASAVMADDEGIELRSIEPDELGAYLGAMWPGFGRPGVTDEAVDLRRPAFDHYDRILACF